MNREEYEAKKQHLLDEIERAFGGLTREKVGPASIIARGFWNEEALAELILLGADTEAHWQDIPLSIIAEFVPLSLWFMDAHSFSYYLPAFLSWYLRTIDQEDNESPWSIYNAIVRALTVDLRRSPRRNHQHRYDAGESQRQKFSELTPEQSDVIAHVLVFLCERLIFLYGQPRETPSEYEFQSYQKEYQEFQLALENHWGRFLGHDFSPSPFPFPAPPAAPKAPKPVFDPQKLAAYEAKKAALIAEIEHVFDGVERKDGVTLHEADAIDSYGSPEERAEARLLDTETRWQDVPDDDIRWNDSNLSFLDAKGFHYYFPAYLTWYLRFIDYEDEEFYSNTFDAVEYKCSLPEDDQLKEYFLEQFSLFSNEQKRTIAHFVQFQQELKGYWDEQIVPSEDSEQVVRLKAHLAEIRAGFQDNLDKYWFQFL